MTSNIKAGRRVSIGQWFGRKRSSATPSHSGEPGPQLATAAEIEVFIVKWVAQKLRLPAESIARNRNLTEYGFDSLLGLNLSGRLEELLGRTLSPSIVWERPTVSELATYLAAGGSGSEIRWGTD